jgi:putative Ig domain-containing protein/Big-like domain-containing protein
MVRSLLLLCLVVGFLLTPSALAHTPAGQAVPQRSAVAWMSGYTLVLVDTDSKAELAETADFISSQGGTIAIILPPRAILGWIPPDVATRITGRRNIRSVHRTPIDSVPAGFNDAHTRMAIRIFNDVASGRAERRARREARNQTTPTADRPAMTDCALPRPPINRQELIQNLRSMGATESLAKLQSSVSPQFFGNSDVMDGSVAVAVFLVESAGGEDPNLYNWSQSDQATAVAQVIDGLNWWVDQSRAFGLGRPLRFTVVPFLANDPAVQVPYEPILHPGTHSFFWIGRIMQNLGGTSSDISVRVAAFNQKIRDENHANWGFSIFIAYNPPPAANAYSNGQASWAYLGGPHASILFRSFGWPLSQIVTHETGHIFYACDEYSQPGYQTCSCSCAPEVRPQAANGNCELASCNAKSIPCMMRINEYGLCQFTVAQIGWTGRVLPPPPTAPAGLVATASSPTQVNLLWQDTSTTEDGFQIERKGGSDGSFSQIAVIQANSTTYIDTTVLSNTAYAYRVRAFNTVGASEYAREVSVITPTTSPTLSIATTDMPDATVGVPYSRALIANGGAPTYAWLVESGVLPGGLSMSQSGTISGTPATAGTFNFVVRVADSASGSATKALRLVVKPAAPLTITTKELPRGSVGTTYSENLGASGGQTPYTWSLQSGNLPDGLSLNQSGTIAGLPERAGTSSFVLKLTDAVGDSLTATLSILINPAITVLTLETNTLPDGVVGQDYLQTLRATGGNAPYRWEISVGRLPDGLILTEAGVIQGKPIISAEYEFTVKLSDQTGQVVTRQLDIDIDPAPELTIINPAVLVAGAVGVPYRVELKATSGTAPYTWIRKGKKKKIGTLPDGIEMSADGILTGTPTVQGIFNFTVRVGDAAGKQASKAFSIEVGPPPPPLEIRTQTLPSATQTLPYSAQLEAGGGLGPYTWTVDAGVLPDGLTMSQTGLITGRATTIGAVSFTVRVRDSLGTSSIKLLFITVVPPPPPLTIQTVQLAETTAERSYSTTLQATGGVPPYSWSIASGSLPQGLNLSASGQIAGTPTQAGTSVFVVKVTDSAQQTVSRTLAIIVRPADKLAPFGALETPDYNATLNNTASGTGWALDNVGISAIEILVDGQKVGEAIYGLPRPDIGVVWGNFPNARNSGFSFTFNTSNLGNGPHTLAVRLMDAGGNATLIGQRTFNSQNQVFQIINTELVKPKKGEPYSAQLMAANGRPPYQWTLVSGALPAGLSLNVSGQISGTPTVFGAFIFGVRATDSVNTTALATLSLTVLPDVEPLRILSVGDLTAGLTGVAYTHQLFFAGGTAPRVWSMVSGALPTGLSLNTLTGLISGTPTVLGIYSFTVRLSDATLTTVTSDTLRITVTPGPLVITTTGDLPPGRLTVPYSFTLQKAGGQGPYTWAHAVGGIPLGMGLDANTGLLYGIPTQTGTFLFTVRLTDSQTPPASVTSMQLRLVIDVPPLTITSVGDMTGGKVGTAYAFQLTFSGGLPPVTWSLPAGVSLPAGLTLNATTGLISGIPTQAGTFNFTVRLTDSTPTTVTSGNIRLVISP